MILDYLPADGTIAAVDWRYYGRSRWQLSDETTPIDGACGRGATTANDVAEFGIVAAQGDKGVKELLAVATCNEDEV